MKKCLICKIAPLIGGIGAINWGLVALFDFNLVTALLGNMTTSARIIYGLIAGMGIILVFSSFRTCSLCKNK